MTSHLASALHTFTPKDSPEIQFLQADGLEDLSALQLSSLKKKFRTKRDLYGYLDTQCKFFLLTDLTVQCLLAVGYFLPSYEQCHKLFLGQVIAGKKQVLLRKCVPRLYAPRWPELNMADIWSQLARDDEVMSYFPSNFSINCLPPREYFWGVLQALRPTYCEQLIDEASQKRAEFRCKEPNTQTLLNVGITKQWAELLLERPFTSRKYSLSGNRALNGDCHLLPLNTTHVCWMRSLMLLDVLLTREPQMLFRSVRLLHLWTSMANDSFLFTGAAGSRTLTITSTKRAYKERSKRRRIKLDTAYKAPAEDADMGELHSRIGRQASPAKGSQPAKVFGKQSLHAQSKKEPLESADQQLGSSNTAGAKQIGFEVSHQRASK